MTTSMQKMIEISTVNPVRPRRQTCFTAAILFALLLTLCSARAEGPDDDYLIIYGIIDQADTLAANGRTTQAHAKYIEAQRALAGFKRSNPHWSTETVNYRMNYLAGKITATAGESVAPGAGVSTGAQKAGVPSAKSPVKLLAAGSEPRTVLRLHPTVGDKQTISMTMKMDMAMGAAGNQMPAINIPAMLMTMEVAVKNISTTGDITYEIIFTDASVGTATNMEPAMAAMLKSSLAGIQGMTGTGNMSSQGIVSSMEMKLAPGANPQLRQTMDQMKDAFSSSVNALPEEAVGPGARWEYKTKLKSQGMTVDQSINYELVSIDGDRLTLRNTIRQSSANQKVESPAMPGTKIDLIKMTGNGTGSTTLDLGKIMPITGTMDEKTESSMVMNIGQQKQPMDMKMSLKLTLEAK